MLDMKTDKRALTGKLRGIPVFAGLPDHDLDTLSEMVTFRHLPKGSFVVTQNDSGAAMYFLVSGRVKVSLASSEGKELALNYLEAPSHFGEMSLVDAEPRSADVIAMSDVELLVLDASDLTRAIQEHPELGLALFASISVRLRELIGRLEDMAFHDATHRVKRVLLNVATASYEARGVPVVEGLTHYEIATLAGTSRETVSRVVSALCKDGTIATKGRRIVVDLIGLRAILDSD